MASDLDSSAAHEMRPHSQIVNQGLLACLITLVPAFVISYFLTVPDGAWPAVVVTQVLASLFTVLMWVAYRRARVWVTPTGITERGFFGRTSRFPLEKIGSIIGAETFDSNSATTVPQLFVCDAQGRTLVRLRGQFWSAESMDLVISTLPVPYVSLGESLSNSELGDDYPGLLYWFERHPVFTALAGIGATAIVGTLVYFVTVALGLSTGMPSSG